MMKTLTTDQIQALHTFVKKHYVEYYDIELELVDHLANGIESQWREDGSLTFETVLDREFKKFGVFGFSTIIEKKENSLTYFYLGIILKEVLRFLHWPKLLLTSALFYIIYTSLNYLSTIFENRDIISVIIWSLMPLVFIYYIIEATLVKKLHKATQKKWFMDRIRLSVIAFPLSALYITYYFARFIADKSIVLSSVLILFVGLWIYITYNVISPKLKLEKEATIKKFNTL
ncbi:hypothetical protein [Myroides odoratimimus]|uniref:hypothetical protein n=1 Tax=Myroides odoratimimus TaxID=76832 RepID=UPI0025749A91|nr:hypothetical protein [Myroides odoratimimus]